MHAHIKLLTIAMLVALGSAAAIPEAASNAETLPEAADASAVPTRVAVPQPSAAIAAAVTTYTGTCTQGSGRCYYTPPGKVKTSYPCSPGAACNGNNVKCTVEFAGFGGIYAKCNY